jgi:hypothetical protein
MAVHVNSANKPVLVAMYCAAQAMGESARRSDVVPMQRPWPLAARGGHAR